MGKTAAAGSLANTIEAKLLPVRAALAEILGATVVDRRELQRQGAALDARTNGAWLRNYLAELAEGCQKIVVDSLRTMRQTVPILEWNSQSSLIFLEASDETRRHRYREAAVSDPVKASADSSYAVNHPTEREVNLLRAVAALTIESDELSPQEIANVIVSQLHIT